MIDLGGAELDGHSYRSCAARGSRHRDPPHGRWWSLVERNWTVVRGGCRVKVRFYDSLHGSSSILIYIINSFVLFDAECFKTTAPQLY